MSTIDWPGGDAPTTGQAYVVQVRNSEGARLVQVQYDGFDGFTTPDAATFAPDKAHEVAADMRQGHPDSTPWGLLADAIDNMADGIDALPPDDVPGVPPAPPSV